MKYLTDEELPPLTSDAHWAERIKTLMQQAGMPDSTSLYSAFRQFQNEMERDAVQMARQAAEAQRLKSEGELLQAKAREWIDAEPTVMALTARIAELEAENEAQAAEIARLQRALTGMVETFQSVPEVAQNAFDEPPEPKTQWDYEAFLVLNEARAALNTKEQP